MLEKAPIIFMIPQIIFCEVLIFGDDTQEAMFTYTQTVMSQGEIYNTFSVKNLTPHVLAQEIFKRTWRKKNLKILLRLLSLHVIKASGFEPEKNAP